MRRERPRASATARRQALAGFGSAKGSNEEAYSVPEAGAHRLRHQQRRPLHAAVPRLVGGGADGGHRLGRGHRALHRGANSDVVVVIGANPTENHPVAATYFKQAAKRGAKLIVIDPRGRR
jgi:formate dehydrogenase major subunit